MLCFFCTNDSVCKRLSFFTWCFETIYERGQMALNFNKFPFSLTAAVRSLIFLAVFASLAVCFWLSESYRVLMKCNTFFFSLQVLFVIWYNSALWEFYSWINDKRTASIRRQCWREGFCFVANTEEAIALLLKDVLCGWIWESLSTPEGAKASLFSCFAVCCCPVLISS